MMKALKNIKQFILHIIIDVYLIILALFVLLWRLCKGQQQFFKKAGDEEKEVIILGNGPSLKDIDLDKIKKKNRKVACVNYFPIKNNKFFEIKPDYLCLFDPGFFDFVIGYESKDYYELLSVLEKVDWNLKIICPVGKRLKVNNSLISYIWLNTNVNRYYICDALIYFLYKKNMLCFGYQNVILGALYYFISSQFKKIYIAGIDMSEFKNLYVDEKNRIYVNSTHDYGTARYYFDEMSEHNLNVFYEILGAYQKMFVEFHLAKEYAKKMNVNIFNLSLNSYVDSFPKINPKDFLNDNII